MLRDLNDPNDRYVGTVDGGVLGSLVPATGTDGPSILYPLIQADQSLLTAKVRAKIVRFPTVGTLTLNDDGSGIYQRSGQGTDSFDFQLYRDSVPSGPLQTITLVVGNGGGTSIGKSAAVKSLNMLRLNGF